MDDRYCLSLFEIPGLTGRFSELLRALDITLPSELPLAEFVRLGWLAPRSRVRLPDSFVRQRPDLFPKDAIAIPPEDGWALRLWKLATNAIPEQVLRSGLTPGDSWDVPWYERDDDLARAVRDHEVPAGPGAEEPYIGTDPWGRPIPAWMDLYEWWQAYEVVEVLGSTPLCAPIRNVPSARSNIEHLLAHFDRYQRYSDDRLRGVKNAWRRRRVVFLWIGAYRAVYGLWAHLGFDRAALAAAAERILARLGLSREALCAGIQTELLVLWHDTTWQEAWNDLPMKARESLRQDLAYASKFVHDGTGIPVDQYDEFWDPADPNPRRWARLPDVLPYEALKARERFAAIAVSYLEAVNSVLAAPYDETRLRALLHASWHDSWTLRRFVIAFYRLHEHYGGGVNREYQLRLIEETPVEFLAQCALFTEKFLNNRYLDRTAKPELEGFSTVLGWLATNVESRLNVAGLASTVKGRVRDEAQLKTLPITKIMPFQLPVTRKGPNARRDRLIEGFVNFAKLRHYAAHHDVLDSGLLDRPEAAAIMEGTLLVLLMTMES